MDYDQFWMWMEFNRVSTFLSEREDLRHAQLMSKLHNVNTVEKSHLTTPKDFMRPSIDQIIEEEMAEEESKNNTETQLLSFKNHVAHLKSIGRPMQTIKV